MHKMTFIGAGNMARSIIGGLIDQGASHKNICATDPNSAALESIQTAFGVQTSEDNITAVRDANVIILAIKPQVMAEVCGALKAAIQPGSLVISIAAGITCKSLQHWLGANVPIVRCMPNTPALVQMGASGMYATTLVSTAQKQQADTILKAVGHVHWVEHEPLIDAVTAVSGSGPAYFFLMLEAMVDAGVTQGLDRTTAQALAIQTAAGAAKLAHNSDVDLAELRKRVTSPGGTTEQAINMFEQCGFRQTISKAMDACKQRAEQMALELGETT